jgi:hypothetical protein
MIQVVNKETGLPTETVTQVSIDVMTFNTEAPNINTYYKCCDENGKVVQSGNYSIAVIPVQTSFENTITEIENAVLSYLTLVRE